MRPRYLIVDGHSAIFGWPELAHLHARRSSLARDTSLRNCAIIKITPAFVWSWSSTALVRLRPMFLSRTECRFSIRAQANQPTPSLSASLANTVISSTWSLLHPIGSSRKRPAPVAPTVFQSTTCGRFLRKRCRVRLLPVILLAPDGVSFRGRAKERDIAARPADSC